MPHFGECVSSRKFTLEYLPIHVLHVVFKYLDIRSLLALSAVCKRLNNIVKYEYIDHSSLSLLVTNQSSPEMRQKSLQILSGIHKYRNNFHWRKKCYNGFVFLKSVERFRPWLRLRSKDLFVSQGSKIFSFKRNKKGINHKPYVIFNEHVDDVVRFSLKDNVMISGGNDGKICCWNTEHGKLLFSVKTPIRWNDNLYTDFKQDTVVAGYSLLGDIVFWLIKDGSFAYCTRLKLNERLRSLSLSNDASCCALGSCGYKSSPFKIFDINREMYLNISGDFKVGAGVYDIIWETPHILLTGGFDSTLRIWDTRIGGCVQLWSDPFDTGVYTLATDYNFTIMTGSALHSRITLWDKRRPRPVQVYFVSKDKFAGPVYSFDFDPTFMFVALDTCFNILDFSVVNRRP